MNHTPGPWTPSGQLILGPIQPHPNPKATPSHVIIGEVYWDWERDLGGKEYRIKWHEAEANQRIMCAAPDLLSACEQALKLIGTDEEASHGCGSPQEVAEDLRLAIKKARGE